MVVVERAGEEATESTGVLVCKRRTVTRLHGESLIEGGGERRGEGGEGERERERTPTQEPRGSRHSEASMNERTNVRTIRYGKCRRWWGVGSRVPIRGCRLVPTAR